jgi:hypothetical protein
MLNNRRNGGEGMNSKGTNVTFFEDFFVEDFVRSEKRTLLEILDIHTSCSSVFGEQEQRFCHLVMPDGPAKALRLRLSESVGLDN